jgi:hypothetical protein
MQPDAQDFSHPKLNEQVTAIGGSYFLIKEVRLPFEGQELLYLIGAAIFDTTCCGTGGCAYALVPGFVHKWKYKADDNGRPVSQVSMVAGDRLRERIKAVILKNESVHQVDFI